MTTKDPQLSNQIILKANSDDIDLIKLDDGTTIVDGAGNIDAPVTTTNLTVSGTLAVTGATTLSSTLAAGATTITGAVAVTGNTALTGTLAVDVDDTGHDVTFFGATAGQKVFWDESADTLNLDCTNQIDGTVTVGVDDTGYDVKFFGATAGAYMLWDESADELIMATGASIDLTADKVMIDFKDGDASTIDPSATAETGWLNVNVDGTKYYVPYYAAS